jgi:protein phosphatase
VFGVWFLADGNLDWQSKGHTLLNEFLETDANRSPEMQKRYGHIVTKSVAGKREKSTPEILEIKNISEKDSFVLCSDGVHNTLTVDHLRLLLSENDNLTQIQEYLKIHADDNYSLILVNN